MKGILYTYCLFFPLYSFTQVSNDAHLERALKQHLVFQQEIIQGGDTITYYLKEYDVKPTRLVVFIQGSDANPLFSYDIREGKPTYYRWFLDDYKNLDSTYAFAIIPKPGMEGIYNDDDISIPQKYYEKNHRDYRVNQIHQTIEHVKKNHLSSVDKVIVYGHSEGAVIAAALAQVNESITHLGFWSGNVLNNFYEFSFFDRISALQGKQTDSLAHENIMGLIAWYQSVIDAPDSTELDQFGFTNKRWATYENPPLEDLLNIDIPIYTMFATKDESTPIETAYLLPIQFMEKRKSNLSFNVCMNCDHGYVDRTGKEEVNHWDRIFGEFIEWTENN